MRVKSWKVTNFAVRPAGKLDECFYCNEKLGDEHKLDCVIRRKTVVIDITIRMVRPFADDMDKDTIEFYLNDSRFCIDNILIGELENLSEQMGCLCAVTESKFVREATFEDEMEYKISIEKIRDDE